MDLFIHTLANGIRIVHHRTSGMVAHCGIMIDAGSRDEKDSEHGAAHFIEHMLFKGTRKRRSYHILSRLDDVGGELNAYTTKEETAVHASFLKENYERAVELISDVTFNSTFPDKEIEKEKDVVIEEINSYLDNPSELIFDEFEEMVFAGQPLCRNILGTPVSVRAFSHQSLVEFIRRNYLPGSMVFCSVGNIDDHSLLSLCEKHLGNADPGKSRKRKSKAWIYMPENRTIRKNTNQNHCIIGNVAYNLRDKRRPGLFLMNNILGGQGLNSRLNLSLREKNGLVYTVESGFNSFTDTGIFSIYFGTDNKNFERSLTILNSEMKKLRTTALGSLQLSKAKKQIMGYLARGFESHESLMLSLGKSILTFNKIDTLEEISRKIEKITPSDLMAIANDILDPSKLSMLVYK